MKHTCWAVLTGIAIFALLAVLTPRSLTAGRAGHAKTSAIRGQPYFNLATTQCIDYWAATSSTNVPEARGEHTAVWTGSEMIIWGGETFLNTGARYNPTTDTWTATSTTNAPEARALHTTIWTDSEMIVWGGSSATAALDSGGRYCASPRVRPSPRPRPTPAPRP